MDAAGDEDGDLHDLFDSIDVDSSGEISPQEAINALKQYAATEGHTLTKRDWAAAKKIFQRNDANKSGGIDFEEFKGVVHDVMQYIEKNTHEHKPRKQRRDEIKQIFKKLDVDNNGKLSYPEVDAGFQGYANQNDFTPTNADWKYISDTFNQVGNNEPEINYNQFKKLAKGVDKRFNDGK